MKKILFCFITVMITSGTLFSQVAINQADMPATGDTLRVSVTNDVPSGYEKTAMDTTWNYAALEALGQRVDSFMTTTVTPSAYQLVFVLLGGANLAAPRNGNLIPGVPLTKGFTFYKNSSSSFSDLGSAFTVQNIPLPAKYDTPDKYYEFPMPPGKTWSSTASFSITVPTLVFYSTQRMRSNVVDGWGTLVTPFGSFQTVRVKSTLVIHDSVYVDSLGMGFPINRNIVEYKWLGKAQGIPLLQVNEEGSQVTASYRDIPRMSALPMSVTLGPDTAVFKGTNLTLHAVVKNGTPPYQIFWNTLATGDTIMVNVQDTRTYSVIVIDALQNIGTSQKLVSVKYHPGIEEHSEFALQVNPNPVRGKVMLRLPENCKEAALQLLTGQGKMVVNEVVHPSSCEFSKDLSALPPGIYFVKVTTKSRIYSGKIQVIK